MEKIKNYKDLIIWNKGIEILENVYKATKKFPDEERYCLAQQMRRAAISISSNIAEGFARQHNKEYKHFLYISLGSCSELITQFHIAHRLGYIDKNLLDKNEAELEYLSRMIMTLIKKICF